MTEPPQPGEPDAELTPLEVSIEPQHQAGVWANFARVNHSPHEFTIDFVRIDFGSAPRLTGIVVARVAVSPLFITQLIGALQENWQRYAEKALPREVYGGDEPGTGGSQGPGA